MLSPRREETTSRHQEAVHAVRLHCETHLDDDLRLSALARIVGFSPHHFHRIFRSVAGEAPRDFVLRLRLERAAYRLKISPDHVLLLAVEAGFASHETFSRAFQRHFGMSPTAFRAALREYRAIARSHLASRTVAGFTDDTPFTLRFDLQAEPLAVEVMPARHLLCLRHEGYDFGSADPSGFFARWDPLVEYAELNGIPYSPDTLIGIAHDDPYVTDESHLRFDACVVIDGPVDVGYPLSYRALPAGLCVTRRHAGGAEEIARTFSLIGVKWLTSDNYGLGPGAPFEVHSVSRENDGQLRRHDTVSAVPVRPLTPITKKRTTP